MGACMVVPRATFNRIGGMDERFYMNSEEVDFQYRLSNAGVDRYIFQLVYTDVMYVDNTESINLSEPSVST